MFQKKNVICLNLFKDISSNEENIDELENKLKDAKYILQEYLKFLP